MVKSKLDVDNVSVEPKLKYRYFCDACTERAFYSSERKPFNQAVCQNCGHVVYYKPENYFELSPEESAKVNG